MRAFCSRTAMAAAFGDVMRGERVLTLLLEAGDVIHLCHHHDSGCSACLSHWEIDAVVTENPAVVCDRVAVKWAHTARQLLVAVSEPQPGRVRRLAMRVIMAQ